MKNTVDKELEKIRKQNKKISEQWKKEVEAKARKIGYFLGVVKGFQPLLKLDTDMLPSDDEIRQISVFLAKSIYPNPLNEPFPIPKTK